MPLILALLVSGCITGSSGSPGPRDAIPVSVAIDLEKGWGAQQIIGGLDESGIFDGVQVAGHDFVLKLTQPQMRFESGQWAPLRLGCLMTIVGIVAGPCIMATVVNEYAVDVVRGSEVLDSFEVKASVVSWNTLWNDAPQKRLSTTLGREIGLALADQVASRWPIISARLAEPPRDTALAERAPSRSELIVSIQRKLTALDYYDGEWDGLLGAQTVSSIERFQAERNLKVDGRATRELLQRLAFAYTRDPSQALSIQRDETGRPASVYQGSEKRIALVVGNSKYTGTGRLANAGRDAAAMAELLGSLGFDTRLLLDANVDAFRAALRAFGARKQNADIALFYYAGHALQVNGTNHLVPVNARLESERDLFFDAVSLDLITGEVADSTRAQIVILDACRDNPFAARLAASMPATRSMGGSRGLAVVTRKSFGTLLAYATAPDSVAADGAGEHSPYTTALLRWLPEPGLEISEVFRKVRNDVIASTHRQQVPWENSSLVGDGIYLGGE